MRQTTLLLLALVLMAFNAHGQGQAPSAQALNDAALVHYQEGRYAEAIAQLQRSLRIDASAKTHFALAVCFLQIEAFDDAGVHLLQAARLDLAYLPRVHALASRLMRSDNPRVDIDRAQGLLEQALTLAPGDTTTLSRLSSIYYLKSSIGIDTTREEMARYRDRAEKLLRQLLEQKPADSQAHMLLGQILGTRGQFNSAILEFQKAVKANPANHEAWLCLGMDYYRIGLFDDAAQALGVAGKSEIEYVRENANRLLREVEQQRSGR